MLSLKIPSSATVKSTVKASLADKYMSAVIAAMSAVFAFLFLYLTALALLKVFDNYFIIVAVSVAIFAILLAHPILLGAVRWFWRATDGCDEGPETVFYYFSSFSRYMRAIKCVLYIGFKTVGAFFVCLLPYLIVTLLSNSWIYQFLGTEMPVWSAALVLLQSFLRIAGIFIAVVLSAKYYLAPAVVVMDDGMHLLEAVYISVMISRNSLGAFASLIVSLFFWILASFTLLPLVYTVPFILGCYVVHCRYALVNYNMTLDYFNEGKFDE